MPAERACARGEADLDHSLARPNAAAERGGSGQSAGATGAGRLGTTRGRQAYQRYAQSGRHKPGWVYGLADGTKGYAKFYRNTEQMQTEVLANQIYRALGINAPDSKLQTLDGKKCIFAPLIENAKQHPFVSDESTSALQAHPQVMAGFAADAILANHDVVGLDHDNVMFGADGQAHRMDNGGALKYRA